MNYLPGEKLAAVSRTDEICISFSISVPVASYITKIGKTQGKNVQSTNNLSILDSFQFMSQTLESLAETLKADDYNLLKFLDKTSECELEAASSPRSLPLFISALFQKFNEPLPSYGNDWKNTLTGIIDISVKP